MEFTRLERYSRLKTLFRALLAIPIVILRYVINLLLEIGALAAWVVIIVTGKLPRGLFGRVPVPAHRNLPAVPGRADADGRRGLAAARQILFFYI
jgi:hypothetical protein